MVADLLASLVVALFVSYVCLLTYLRLDVLVVFVVVDLSLFFFFFFSFFFGFKPGRDTISFHIIPYLTINELYYKRIMSIIHASIPINVIIT